MPRAGRDACYGRVADEDLISFVAAGDALAFAALHDRHSRAANSLAWRMTKNRQSAEDLAQDAFFNVWQSAGGFRAGRGSVRRWILSIVQNRGIDRLRSAAGYRRMQDGVEVSAERSQPCEAFAQAWRDIRREQVGEALVALPHEQREAIALAYFSGHTHKEIAGLLGLPLGTVEGSIRLGLRRLEERLGAGKCADGASNAEGRGGANAGRRAPYAGLWA